jgi:phosphoglucosamine mutase
VITTPGVAYLARTRDFAAGVVISASHNPWQDNGIKVFGHDGYKLPDEVELEIERDIFGHLEAQDLKPSKLPLQHDHALRREYVKWLDRQVEGLKLAQISAIVDCANGAATPIAHEVFAASGVPAVFLSDQPDGRNINENCGALHPDVVAGEVRENGRVSLGITFDGDADRALFSDENGHVVNGDAVMLLSAREMQKSGTLTGNAVVATTMSNMGLEKALRTSGIRMLRAPVGDKYVLEQMQSTGAVLGGEQSGHIIFRDRDATTGDGLLTALRVLSVMARTGKKLSELVADLKMFPQTIKNVRVREKQPLEEIPSVASAIHAAEQELDGNGRVVVRYSGTEALARVMIEAESEETMKRHADAIAGAIQQAIGA